MVVQIQLKNILIDINKKIGDYLAVKTLINIILSIICFSCFMDIWC